jgi:uncharacterized damage-inducible protein DinB
MPALTPEQAHFLLNTVLLDAIKKESRTTKKVLESVPADKMSYQPDPNAKTAEELLRHIASAEQFFLEAPANGAFVPGSKIPEGLTAPADIAKWYEETCAKNFDALSKLSGEQLAKDIDFRGMFQQSAVLFLIFGLNHTIHHRGQLSTYLRPMGAKIPAIYGESYDSAAAKKAAQAG